MNAREMVSKVSRLGRSTVEVLQIVEELPQLGSSIYVQSFGLETLKNGNRNPVAQFMFTLLADIVRLRWQACRVGFAKITLKRDTLKGYLPAHDDHKAYFQGEQFGTILNYMQTHPRTARLKEHKAQLIVTFEEVRSI